MAEQATAPRYREARQIRIHTTRFFKRGAHTLALTVPVELVESLGAKSGDRVELEYDTDEPGRFAFRVRAE